MLPRRPQQPRGGSSKPWIASPLALLVLLVVLLVGHAPAASAGPLSGRFAVASPSAVHRQRWRSPAFLSFSRDDGGHEGAKLGRSGVWARLHNATGNLIDKLGDAIEDEKKAIGDFIAREMIALDKFEDSVSAWWGRHRRHVQVGLKAVTGATMCMTGAHFGRCVVLFHSVRVTGWPAFKNAVIEIERSYKRAREVVKEEVSGVLKPRELLKAVTFELASVRKIITESQEALADGKIDKAEAKQMIRQAEIDMKRLSYEAWVLNQAVDSMAALSAAIDFPKLKDIAKSVYTGALACVASASSVTVRKLSLAFDLGAIISHDLSCVFQTFLESIHSKELARVLPPETRRFARLTIQTVGTIKGLLIVNSILPKMSLRISSAALGGAWLTDALAETMDPFLRAHGWPVIQDHLPHCLLQTGFTAAGYIIQKRHPGRFPLLIERALQPLTFAEDRLKSFKGFKGGLFGVSRWRVDGGR